MKLSAILGPSGLAAIALFTSGAAGQESQSPLKDADFYWTMADAGETVALKTLGKVTLGVDLPDTERQASLDRGGDGKAARFEGGHLALSDDAALKINPERWAIAIRMRDPEGIWRYPILGSYGDDKRVSFALRAVDGLAKPMTDRNLGGGEGPTIYAWMFRQGGPRSVPGDAGLLEAVWGAEEANASRVERICNGQPEATWPNPLQQDVLNAVMKPCFPVSLIGPADWHDIVVNLTGPKLELWIDGVLVDEEFPIGVTRNRTLPFLIGAGRENGELKTGFRGLVDHVAIWNRPLKPEEIAKLSGGAAHAREREIAILGDESPSMQYFRARGHNRKAGDLIPYWDEQTNTFRLFYLILRRNMHSKWDGGHGGLEIWQASTQDLKTWTHHPVTIPITEQWEAWNGTGAVAYLEGKYHWFYPTPDYDTEKGGIQHAVSGDGVHFTKREPHPFLEGGDCEVFRTDDGVFHMIKAGPVRQASTTPVGDKTFVAWVRLKDLQQRGGSAFTIEAPDRAQFDALVFGEIVEGHWMAGSNNHRRSSPGTLQQKWAVETAKPDEMIQMALVYRGKTGTLYRNGMLYGSCEIPEPVAFPSGSSLMIGWRHTGGGPPDRAYFRGQVLDARLYDRALSAAELGQLKRDAPGGPAPAAWYDFEDGSLRDRAGRFPDARLFGKARIEDGALVLDGDGDYLKALGSVHSQVRLTSGDLENWTEVAEPAITADERLATCPNLFRFGDWHYYLCSSGVWRSEKPFGPWIRHSPERLDNLSVPKTAAFGKDRRIYAGFLPDGGWGGNSVLRELVQDENGRLGTRFVPEMIPASGQPIAVTFEPKPSRGEGSTVHVGGDDPASVSIPNLPGDFRLQVDIEPSPEAVNSSFGIGLRARSQQCEDGCDLIFQPGPRRVLLSKMSDSGGGIRSGTMIDAVEGMNRPFTVDVIVRHDLIDVEIGGFRTVTTRFWNPGADRIRLFGDAGTVTFRDIRVQPLTDLYEPYPGWREAQEDYDPLALSYHLMHPGGESSPGDPNAAFCLDGTYHLHYILRHDWEGKKSFSFVHVTSPDMLRWTWQPTRLQPSFTGHGMFSGTGFLTREGKPAAIYHGQGSGRNQIAIAKDRKLSAWEKPYPVEVKTADGKEPGMRHWDPDCFLVGDTYYAISGGENPPLIKSKDLRNWTVVGDFLRRDMPDVAYGEDISCPNFFPIGDKWMLLCISHPLGCRYYLGDWDAKAEQFVPEQHGRLNWRRDGQSLFGRPPWRVDFFAPESVLTPDGRRVMWAWLATLGSEDGNMDSRTIESLPRELSLPADGILRVKPLRELETLRHDPVVLSDIRVASLTKQVLPTGAPAGEKIGSLRGDSSEIRITIAREQAARKLFGFVLFADGKGGGLPIVFRPETGALRVGTAEAPFSIADLPVGEDVELRIFIDKYLVEVFANDRQSVVASCEDYRGKLDLNAFTVGASLTIKKVESWQIEPTNQGFFEARRNRAWEPDTN